MAYLVVGHFTATDDDPGPDDGKLAGAQALSFRTAQEARTALLWLRDGVVLPLPRPA